MDRVALDLDVFRDALFAEPRTGAIIDSLILGIGRRPRAARRDGQGGSEGSVTVQFAPDAGITFTTAVEAERFVAAIAAVCDEFGLECRWAPSDS